MKKISDPINAILQLQLNLVVWKFSNFRCGNFRDEAVVVANVSFLEDRDMKAAVQLYSVCNQL